MASLSVKDPFKPGIFLDIESTLSGKIREIAYIYQDERVIASTAPERENVFTRLNTLAQEAAFIGGHNILWNDLPILADKGKCGSTPKNGNLLFFEFYWSGLPARRSGGTG